MDEISSIQSTDVLITSKFFMVLKPLEEGESFTLSKTYSSSKLSIDEVKSLSEAWESSLKQEIISRLVYAPTEINGSFGHIALCLSKSCRDEVHIDEESGRNVASKNRTFSFKIKFTALEKIASGSLLRL